MKRQAKEQAYYDEALRRHDLQGRLKIARPAVKLVRDSDHVLDLGCGSGAAARLLCRAGHQVTAVDFSSTGCRLTRKNAPEATVIQHDLREALPCRGDAAVVLQVLEHVEDDVGLVRSALVAAPLVVASVPNEGRISSPAHIRKYTRKSIRARFSELGCVRFHESPARILLFSVMRRGAVRELRMLAVIGHPRSGTKYMARLLTAHGLDVRHEELGADGISSWCWGVDTEVVPWGDARCGRTPDATYLVVRSPLQVVASTAATLRPRSWAFLERQVGPLPSLAKPVARAMATWARWNRRCLAMKPDRIIRVEEAPAVVAELWGRATGRLPGTGVNARKHRQLTLADLEAYPRMMTELLETAEMLGIGGPDEWR